MLSKLLYQKKIFSKLLPQKGVTNLLFQNCFLKKHQLNSFSPSDSSEEEKPLQLKMICLITFFQYIQTLLKNLWIMAFTFFESKIHLVTAKQVSLEPTLGFFSIKICNFITVRFYFGFQKFFIVDGPAINFFIYQHQLYPEQYYVFLIIHHHQSKNTSS